MCVVVVLGVHVLGRFCSKVAIVLKGLLVLLGCFGWWSFCGGEGWFWFWREGGGGLVVV